MHADRSTLNKVGQSLEAAVANAPNDGTVQVLILRFEFQWLSDSSLENFSKL